VPCRRRWGGAERNYTRGDAGWGACVSGGEETRRVQQEGTPSVPYKLQGDLTAFRIGTWRLRDQDNFMIEELRGSNRKRNRRVMGKKMFICTWTTESKSPDRGSKEVGGKQAAAGSGASLQPIIRRQRA